MVVLTTGKTTTSGVLAVLANTTVTGRDVAAVLASLGEPRRHFLCAHKGPVSVSSHPVSSGHPASHPSSDPAQIRPKRHPSKSPETGQCSGDDPGAREGTDIP